MTANTRDPDTYARLTAEFDDVFTDTRGGVVLSYITGEQCITRLNEVLGPGAWSFAVREHGVHAEADEVWVLGRLDATIDGATVVREQFGSQKIKRSRSTNNPLDIGFDLKGAGTDALKKCASLIGVGLYLSKKEQPANVRAMPAREGAPARRPGRVPEGARDPINCEECGTALKETSFKDGSTWEPAQLAGYGRRKHGKVLCMDHYRAANEAKRTELLTS